MNENRKCYNFLLYNFEDGFFEKSVSATYIIHLKGNGRYRDIQDQLKTYHPTNTVYIVENKGFKECSKILPEQKSPYDLTDAFLQVFKHANDENYQHVLILEDDFMFRETIKEPRVHDDINDFLTTKRNERFVYYLGCIPYIQTMGYSNHNMLWLSGGTHACIYSRKLREYVLQHYAPTDIIDWDVFNNMNAHRYARYVYYQPLCYQLWSVTENSKHWYNPLGLADIIKYIIRSFELDSKVEPGHSVFYILSKSLFVLIFFVLLFLIYRLLFIVAGNLGFPTTRLFPALQKTMKKISLRGHLSE